MLNIIFLLLQINFCNQKININTKFLICNKKIKNFNNLKKFTRLQALNLSGSSFSNIELLKGMKELKILDLSNTSINNLNNIDLKNLLELNIEHTNIINLNPLKNLKNLYYIHVYNISDLNTILTYLKKLLFIQVSNKKNINDKMFYHLHDNIYGLLSKKQIKIIKFMNKTKNFDKRKKSSFHYESLFELFKKEKLTRLIYYSNNPPFYGRNSRELFLETAYLLIKRDININKINDLLYSPLDCALKRCNLSFNNSLVDNLPLSHLEIKDNDFLINLLKQHGALRGKEILKIQKDTQKIIDFILSLNLKQKMLNCFIQNTFTTPKVEYLQ